MKKRLTILTASILLTGAWAVSYPAYADQGGEPDWASESHAQFPDQTPGTDASDPNSYPFLAPGQSKPEPGQRSHSPHAVGSLLSLNLPYTITTQFQDAYWHQGEQNSFPDRGQLTNGQLASLNFSDPQWVGLSYQYRHYITIDLGQAENIHAVSLDFLQNLGAGIDFPDNVQYYVSQDGVNWAAVGTVDSAYGAGDFTPQTQPFELDGINVNARYVRASFVNKVWGFIDQYSVYGWNTPNSAAKAPVGAPLDNQPSGYLTASNPSSGGINNLLLTYTDGYGALGTWTASDFTPMITNEDASGNPKGWLYDGILMDPYDGAVRPQPGSDTATAWSGWLNNIFSSGTQLSALDQAVGQAKQRLSDPTYKEKVVIAIPGLTNTSNFGSVNPGEATLDLNPVDVGAQVAYENKVHAIKWWIDQVESKWQNANFQNLTLAGFYWQPESLKITDPTDAQLVQKTADMVHQQNMNFFWIPFYGAIGVTDWRQLGFDSVTIQPNVSFHWDMDPAARFQSVTNTAKYYGTGLEMEAHWDVIDNWTSPSSLAQQLAQTAQNKYFDYFTAGNVLGYEGNVVKSYYEGSKTLLQAYQSTNPFFHQVYDNTAQFINVQWSATTFR